jgi:hypothetical protein
MTERQKCEKPAGTEEVIGGFQWARFTKPGQSYQGWFEFLPTGERGKEMFLIAQNGVKYRMPDHGDLTGKLSVLAGRCRSERRRYWCTVALCRDERDTNGKRVIEYLVSGIAQ